MYLDYTNLSLEDVLVFLAAGTSASSFLDNVL